MRQYKEASELVLSFLQSLRSDASLPAKFAAEVDAAIKVRRCAFVPAAQHFTCSAQTQLSNR